MRSVFFDPGQMTARLALEAPVETPDGQGGATVAFAEIASFWARIEPVGELREEQAGADVFTLTHRVWLRFRDDLKAGMRLRKGARAFSIRAWRDPDERGNYLVCLCEEESR
ncbi:phage head closure protein [Rhizobium metallidurans]|uniref:SPP1 family predicted phage head-tail adaptor n=1 Tax=Rhizobium metallidurans TaxID=1265931 RepID=A0A7W6GAA6_9HYPH|nr:phage head closure protein [Rhizobium metallidurans]MBB3963730.1 SPP1 family predicted phage head-tail adaptor [Rhizobium metallidurans]